MIEKLSPEGIEELLRKQLVGRIGCHSNGQTYVVPTSFVYDGENIYIHSFAGMKIDFMRKNPKVCFEVDDIRHLENWKSVICWGEFEELTDEASKVDALRKLAQRKLPILSSETMQLSPDWPFSPVTPDAIKGILFRIRIREKTGRTENQPERAYFAT